jgi:hypothetical protein
VLKQGAGSTATAPTYKLKVKRFCKGTVAEWIDFHKAILKVQRQNGITSTQDRVANICTILQGDLLTGFEEKLEEKLQELFTSTNKDGETEVLHITDETISVSLNAVIQMFSFQSIGNPKTVDATLHAKANELSIQKTMTAVRLNNSLPLFPNVKEAEKFTLKEFLKILEWSIPKAWRTNKFNLDGYVQTEFTEERSMTECEAFERNKPNTHIKSKNPTHNGKTMT